MLSGEAIAGRSRGGIFVLSERYQKFAIKVRKMGVGARKRVFVAALAIVTPDGA